MGGDTEILRKTLASRGNLWERFGFWKLAIAKLTCMCLLAACASWSATLNGVEWSSFTGTQKFQAWVACTTAVVTTIVAFLSDTMQKLTVKAEEEKKTEESK